MYSHTHTQNIDYNLKCKKQLILVDSIFFILHQRKGGSECELTLPEAAPLAGARVEIQIRSHPAGPGKTKSHLVSPQLGIRVSATQIFCCSAYICL